MEERGEEFDLGEVDLRDPVNGAGLDTVVSSGQGEPRGEPLRPAARTEPRTPGATPSDGQAHTNPKRQRGSLSTPAPDLALHTNPSDQQVSTALACNLGSPPSLALGLARIFHPPLQRPR